VIAAVHAEFFKAIRRRMTYILASVAVALVAVYYVLLWLQIRHAPMGRRGAFRHWLSLRDGMSFANAIPYGLQLERFFVTFVCIIFAACIVANEFDWRTAQVALGRGVRRRDFLAGKVAIAALFTAAVALAAFATGLALSAWWSHLYGLPFGALDLTRLGHALASLGRNVFVTLPFVAMAMVCAMFARSASQAAGFALGIFFLESIFTGLMADAQGILPHIPEALLNVNVLSVVAENGVVRDSWLTGPFGVVVGGSDVPLARGAGLLAAWTVVLVGVAFWRFSRRDFTA
jgi:ABC-type transport system involved in multi-copper enzyme maturation permease subunit